MRLFHELLDFSPGQRGDACALSAGGIELRYRALTERSFRLARGLRDLGIRKHDRVAIWLSNEPAFIECAMACSRIGAVFVPINPSLRPRQVLQIVSDCGARLLIAASAGLKTLGPLVEREAAFMTVIADDEPREDARAVVSLAELRMSSPKVAAERLIDGDMAAIFYTSGSTGRPKGVVLSHRNLVEGAVCVSSYLENTPDDRILAALPMSFDYGLSQVTTALSVGACAVLTQFAFSATLVRQIVDEKITGLAGVPTMWAHLTRVEWPRECQSQLRYITNSGGPLLPPILGALRRLLPRTRIFSMYGLTEAFRSTYLDPAELDRRPGSIGKAIPNQHILVARPDGQLCAAGETGELVHRGSLVALGYWNDADLTAVKFRPPPGATVGMPTSEVAVWSGDRVRLDEEGFLYFLGRMDDQIKTSGYRISPNEVEEVVVEVDGVLGAVAVGIPHDVLGHQVAVAVFPADGENLELVERIRRHCRRELPLYMVPSEIKIVTTFPTTPNGKPDRRAIADLFDRDGRADENRLAYTQV